MPSGTWSRESASARSSQTSSPPRGKRRSELCEPSVERQQSAALTSACITTRVDGRVPLRIAAKHVALAIEDHVQELHELAIEVAVGPRGCAIPVRALPGARPDDRDDLLL